jgi:hypothetical protein
MWCMCVKEEPLYLSLPAWPYILRCWQWWWLNIHESLALKETHCAKYFIPNITFISPGDTVSIDTTVIPICHTLQMFPGSPGSGGTVYYCTPLSPCLEFLCMKDEPASRYTPWVGATVSGRAECWPDLLIYFMNMHWRDSGRLLALG